MEMESTLADGTRVLFRPIRASDKDMLQIGLQQLSPESRYRRFFRHIDHLSEGQLQYLTEVDGHDHVAWIAVLPDAPGSPGIGVGRYIRLKGEPEVAEAAVTVIDSHHNQGLGRTLLRLLARSAIENGVRAFRAWTLGDNHPMMGLLQDLGARPGRWEGGVLELTVPLPSDVEDLDQTPGPLILREVARGTLQVEAHPDRPAGARLMPPPELQSGISPTRRESH
jgi:GNAT superfamily N-acetyltransferase